MFGRRADVSDFQAVNVFMAEIGPDIFPLPVLPQIGPVSSIGSRRIDRFLQLDLRCHYLGHRRGRTVKYQGL